MEIMYHDAHRKSSIRDHRSRFVLPNLDFKWHGNCSLAPVWNGEMARAQMDQLKSVLA